MCRYNETKTSLFKTNLTLKLPFHSLIEETHFLSGASFHYSKLLVLLTFEYAELHSIAWSHVLWIFRKNMTLLDI